ncbi:MAG TPA: hypothetical protein PL037_08435, partial [Elusimicrobiales bacterium]|nr:hypothetical protein [Elusimicrobiales bacterium]
MKTARHPFVPVILAAALLAAVASLRPAGAGAAGQSAPGVRMEVFFESMDGAGWQWFFLSDVVRKRLSGSETRVYPLLQKNDKGEFESKRGPSEIAESERIAVVGRFYQEKLPLYMHARSMTPWADGWRDAAVFCGISPEDLEARIGKHGKELLEAAYDRAQKSGVTAAGVLIDGVPYEGGARLMPFFAAVNSRLPEGKRAMLPKTAAPPAAAAAPVRPPKFRIVLSTGVEKNDALVNVFSGKFPGIKPEVIDFDSPERAKDFPDLDFLPVYVLELTEDVRGALAEEIKAGIFTERNGSLFYFDKSGKGLFAAAPREPGVLKVFVMSQCPYGVTAENGLIDAIRKKQLPEGVKVEFHYIGETEKSADGKYTFKSLHGTPEWEENVRQLVIAKKFPGKLYDYLLERNTDVTSTQWDDAARRAGLDPKAISDGFEEGKAMLAAD